MNITNKSFNNNCILNSSNSINKKSSNIQINTQLDELDNKNTNKIRSNIENMTNKSVTLKLKTNAPLINTLDNKSNLNISSNACIDDKTNTNKYKNNILNNSIVIKDNNNNNIYINNIHIININKEECKDKRNLFNNTDLNILNQFNDLSKNKNINNNNNKYDDAILGKKLLNTSSITLQSLRKNIECFICNCSYLNNSVYKGVDCYDSHYFCYKCGIMYYQEQISCNNVYFYGKENYINNDNYIDYSKNYSINNEHFYCPVYKCCNYVPIKYIKEIISKESYLKYQKQYFNIIEKYSINKKTINSNNNINMNNNEFNSNRLLININQPNLVKTYEDKNNIINSPILKKQISKDEDKQIKRKAIKIIKSKHIIEVTNKNLLKNYYDKKQIFCNLCKYPSLFVNKKLDSIKCLNCFCKICTYCYKQLNNDHFNPIKTSHCKVAYRPGSVSIYTHDIDTEGNITVKSNKNIKDKLIKMCYCLTIIIGSIIFFYIGIIYSTYCITNNFFYNKKHKIIKKLFNNRTDYVNNLLKYKENFSEYTLINHNFYSKYVLINNLFIIKKNVSSNKNRHFLLNIIYFILKFIKFLIYLLVLIIAILVTIIVSWIISFYIPGIVCITLDN